MFKERLENYTEAEMLDYLREFFENPQKLEGKALTEHFSQLAKHLIKITAHSEGRILSLTHLKTERIHPRVS